MCGCSAADVTAAGVCCHCRLLLLLVLLVCRGSSTYTLASKSLLQHKLDLQKPQDLCCFQSTTVRRNHIQTSTFNAFADLS